MLLHDGVIYQILLWLPVKSLLRFKIVCRTWCALIESSYFIKQHLRLHHYDPNMKDKNHNLIYPLRGMDSSITFALTSVEGFEEPTVCLQLNCSDLQGHYSTAILSIMSYNGIICLNLFNYESEHISYLWNPVTKQSRVLPQSPTHSNVLGTIGFGFDVKNNDYKVVNLIGSGCRDEKRVEVYNLSTNAWRSLTTVFPFSSLTRIPRMPFNNGTCFFWLGTNNAKGRQILCFDFCSEMFRSISLPRADDFTLFDPIVHASVVLDKIACIYITNGGQIETWVFNEYGTVNECWTKLYAVDISSAIDRQMLFDRVSMNGDYIFVKTTGKMYGRFNVVTKETSCFTLENMPYYRARTLVEFKESLVSVEQGY